MKNVKIVGAARRYRLGVACGSYQTRTSFKEEVAMLFSARARGAELFAQIDETTCSVLAMYEVG